MTILWVGEDSPSGSYLLRIRVRQAAEITFGRFNAGKPIHLPAGEYAYVGSAMGKKGSATLARRLLRHATRSRGRPPHPIRAALLDTFAARGLLPANASPPQTKKLHWHVDYLLDHPAAELRGVLVLAGEARLESPLAEILASDPAARLIASGLGASDAPSPAHLLRIAAEDAWWERLPQRLRDVPLTPTPPLAATNSPVSPR